MNILIFVSRFPPEIGSASHLFYELSEGLVNLGHKVTVVTGFPRYDLPKDGNIEKVLEKYKGKLLSQETVNGIRIIRLLLVPLPRGVIIARGLDHFISSVLFFGGLVSGKQDVIFVYSPPLPLAFSVYFLSKIKNIPIVTNIQDLYPQAMIDRGVLKNRFLIGVLEAMERFVYKKSDYLTAHSEGNQDHLVSKGATPSRISVIPNWTDTDLIKPLEKLNEFRKEHNLGTKFIVSFAGIMGLAQGLDSVIETAALLRDYKDILFLLVGDGARTEYLKAKTKELELENVKFLPMQPREKYPSVLHASDACLVTLKKNVATPVVPSKLMNIMASGRPVLASMPLTGDAPKIIKAAQCGYCVEAEAPEALAEAVLKLYKEPDLREEFGKNGRIYAEQHFSRVACVKRYEGLFKDASK